jgi:hypothetical protein
MLHVKRLIKAVGKVPPAHKGLLKEHFHYLFSQYHNEVSYYKSLWANGRITLGEYREKTLPKLRSIKNELEQTARVLQSLGR